jgi:uncharacterized membrane protein YgcG
MTREGEATEAARLRERLLAESFPRAQMLAILSLAGVAAFLCSALLLRFGIAGMPARYCVAAAVGYGSFLALVRVWISWQRGRWNPDFELPDTGAGGGSGAASFEGGGGSFGGGGANASFGPPAAEPSSGTSLDFVPDVDDAWPIALAVAAALAGAIALGFVVWASPILFAEVLLDAAVVGAVYRRARRRSRRHWLRGVVARTWLPAAALCAFVALAGFVLQTSAPEAESLGAVLRAWSAH